MPSIGAPRRIVLLSMDFAGKDGVSAVTRLALEALERHARASGAQLEAWSLFGTPPARPGVLARGAEGNTRRFAGFGLGAAARSGRGTLLIAMHLHLAPVTLPAAFRGARLAVFLHGIEAWRALTWPRLLREAPRATLVVAGDGDDRERLEAKARALELGDRVRFLGRVSDADLAALYRGCTLFAMPSAGEGFGLVFLEAMREGKPVIAGEGAAREVVEDGVTGIVVDPASPDALLAALRRLFAEPETRARMGEAGRARLAARFTAERFRDRFLEALGLAGEAKPCAA